MPIIKLYFPFSIANLHADSLVPNTTKEHAIVTALFWLFFFFYPSDHCYMSFKDFFHSIVQ